MYMHLLALVFAIIVAVPTSSHADDYVIGEGDELNIAVWGVKELTFPVKVRPDGKITVPGLGEVVAKENTPSQLQSLLTGKLEALVKNPIVTVTVTGITNSKVYVFGGGVKSGVYHLLQRTTLQQLLCMVGEVKSADLTKSYLLRGEKRAKENFHKLFIDGDTSEDIILESGDSLFIPPLLDKSIYVLGAVALPKAIEYREGMTVMEAILEAGGFTKFASQNDTLVRRKSAEADISIPVKAKEIIKGGNMEQNIKLKQGDYIIVKESMF